MAQISRQRRSLVAMHTQQRFLFLPVSAERLACWLLQKCWRNAHSAAVSWCPMCTSEAISNATLVQMSAGAGVTFSITSSHSTQRVCKLRFQVPVAPCVPTARAGSSLAHFGVLLRQVARWPTQTCHMASQPSLDWQLRTTCCQDKAPVAAASQSFAQ